MTPNNRLRYPLLFTIAFTLVWGWLIWRSPDNDWIDRLILGEIALCALFAVIAMSIATRHWTVRGLGIWGLMLSIVLIYGVSQLVEYGIVTESPGMVRDLWRAVLAVSGPCMLYGFWVWWREGDGDV